MLLIGLNMDYLVVRQFLNNEYPKFISKRDNFTDKKSRYKLKTGTVGMLYNISRKKKIVKNKNQLYYCTPIFELHRLAKSSKNKKRTVQVKKLDKNDINKMVNKSKNKSNVLFFDYQYLDSAISHNYLLLEKKWKYFKNHHFFQNKDLSKEKICEILNYLSINELEELLQIVDFVINGNMYFYSDNLDESYQDKKLVDNLSKFMTYICDTVFKSLSNFSIKKEEYTLINGEINQNLIKILLNHLNDIKPINQNDLDNKHKQFIQTDTLFNFLYKNNIELSIDNKYILQSNSFLNNKNKVQVYISTMIETAFNAYMLHINADNSMDVDDETFRSKTIRASTLLSQKIVLFCQNFNMSVLEIKQFLHKMVKNIKDDNILNIKNNPYIDTFYYDIEKQTSRKVYFISQIQRFTE